MLAHGFISILKFGPLYIWASDTPVIRW